MQTRHNHKGYIGVSADRSEDPAFAVNTLLSGRSIRFAWQLAVVKKKSLLAACRSPSTLFRYALASLLEYRERKNRLS